VSRPSPASAARLAVVGITTIATLAAGCADADPGADPGGSTASISTGPKPLSAAAVATMSQYTGVKPGPATGTPVKIGFVNTHTGSAAFPDYTVAATEAVRTVNESLGGVKGRPIEFKTCHPEGAAQMQQCAQDFAADPAVMAVLHASTDTGVAGFQGVLTSKIPVLGALPGGLTDAQAPNTFYLGSGQLGALGVVTYAKTYARARSVAVLSVDGYAFADAVVASLKATFEANGMTMTVAKFRPDSADLSQPLTASGAPTADVFIPAVAAPAHCVTVNNALQQLGVKTPVVAFAGCLNSEVRKVLGDYPRWNYLSFNVSTDATATDDLTAWQARAFNEWFAPLADRGVPSNNGVLMLQLVLTATKILTAVPGDNLTPAAVGTQMKRFTGPVFLGVPRLTFGAIPGMPSVGALSSRVYVYLGNDTWRDMTAGQWLEPPAQTGSGRR
jgi:branched-chain amino acid transport system substrate-binding protein